MKVPWRPVFSESWLNVLCDFDGSADYTFRWSSYLRRQKTYCDTLLDKQNVS